MSTAEVAKGIEKIMFENVTIEGDNTIATVTHKSQLETLIRDVCHRFCNDPCAPSVTISYLADKSVFYVSICRYTDYFGKGETVVTKATAPQLEEAIETITKEMKNAV